MPHSPIPMKIEKRDRERLKEIAVSSIEKKLHQIEFSIIAENESPALCAPGASFVTLQLKDKLRGCIGSLRAKQPLALDVSHNALAAAFNDPRFSALSIEEFPECTVSISVLSTPKALAVKDLGDLEKQLKPGTDGLVLEFQGHRATFLPAVWVTLPDKSKFISELARKAGLDIRDYSEEWRFSTYHVDEIK